MSESNNEVSLFERASRMKLRFDTERGFLTVEDLWDLPLISRSGGASLDSLAKDINRQVKEAAEESFVVKASKASERLLTALEVVKRVIAVRLEERDAAEQAEQKRETKRKILEALQKKRDDKLSSASEEELEGMLAAL